MSKYKSVSITILFSLMLLTMVSFSVMASNDSLMITGLQAGDIEIYVSELKGLPTREEDVISVDSSGDEDNYTVKGALFSDVLESKGIDNKNLKTIRLIAGDGYSIEVPEQVLANRDIILTYEVDGKPLYEKTKPVRVVIPEERAMYWVKNLVEIKVLDMVESVNIDSLYFLNTAISQMELMDYTYYESVDKAVKISSLINGLKLDTVAGNVSFMAADGLNKNEKTEIFLDGYIKLSGDHAPMFLSPDIPKGMFVKDLAFVQYGTNVICSVERAEVLLGAFTIEEQQGVNLAKLIKESGLKQADKYRLSASDGYAVEVEYQEMEAGIVYIDEKGRVRSSFANLPGQYSVKYLSSITTVSAK